MKTWFAQINRPPVRWYVAAGLAVAIAGGAGLLAAEFYAPVLDPLQPSQGSTPAAAYAGFRNPASVVTTASESGASKSTTNGAQTRKQMEGIWEVSIGAEAMAAAGIAAPLSQMWRIGGVFESASGPALIVLSGSSGSPQYLSVGQILPNKAEIIAITQDSVTVRTKINRRWVKVTLNV